LLFDRFALAGSPVMRRLAEFGQCVDSVAALKILPMPHHCDAPSLSEPVAAARTLA
jgi:hypothetical protein